MDTVKLGKLVVDKSFWPRVHLDTDHVRCLVNDLINGAAFPPLLVERNSNVIIGGNHRYAAYRKFYSDDWQEKDVLVEYIDLPPYNEDPLAWHVAALEDNYHTVARLNFGDRSLAKISLLKLLEDPGSPEATAAAALLHETPQTWHTFHTTYLGLIKKSHHEPRKIIKAPMKDNANKDIQAGIGKTLTQTPLSSFYAKVNALLNELNSISPALLGERERDKLEGLVAKINLVLRNVA